MTTTPGRWRSVQVVWLSESGGAEQACSCMAEVPSPWPDVLQACRAWIAQNLGTLVDGVHLKDDAGNVVGHIYHTSSEHALIPFLVEPGAVVLHCEWIQRRHQGKGYARLLHNALIQRLDAEGCKGLLVAATDDEGHMHHAHFDQRGYHTLVKAGRTRLMYLPLHQETISVQPLEQRIAPAHRVPVEVTVFTGGFCPYEVSTGILALQVAREFGKRVILKQVPVTVQNLRAYGTASGVFVNGQRLPAAAPEEAIRQAISEALEGGQRR